MLRGKLQQQSSQLLGNGNVALTIAIVNGDSDDGQESIKIIDNRNNFDETNKDEDLGDSLEINNNYNDREKPEIGGNALNSDDDEGELSLAFSNELRVNSNDSIYNYNGTIDDNDQAVVDRNIDAKNKILRTPAWTVTKSCWRKCTVQTFSCSNTNHEQFIW